MIISACHPSFANLTSNAVPIYEPGRFDCAVILRSTLLKDLVVRCSHGRFSGVKTGQVQNAAALPAQVT